MRKKTAVHIKPRQDGWAVVREGNERASSVHRTQAEAAKAGRDIARKEETEFFLHARDGKVREHNSYTREKPPPEGAADRPSREAPERREEEVRQEAGDSVVPASDATEPEHGELSREGGDETQEKVYRPAAEERIDERSGALQERYAGYEIRDINGEKVGEIDHLFVGENDQLEYIGSKTDPNEAGFVLIPVAVLRIDEERQIVEVSVLKEVIEDGPAFESEREVTPEYERRVCDYYGVTYPAPSPAGSEVASTRDKEFRMQRAEEELRVGTREREVGAVVVRKRVVTEHEWIEVPRKRVEVTVERISKAGEPREGETIPAETQSARPGLEEDEIVVPVIEEEVVVEKRPVVKEEIRIRKGVVEDTKLVEEEVRREEVEVDDQT